MRTHQRAQLGGQRGASRRSSAARTLHLLMANLDVTDAELAIRLHTSRQTINSRRKGRVAMTAEDLAELAQALDVDPALFLGQPSDAVRWLVDHQADRLDAVGNDERRHNGEQNGPSPLSPKGSRERCIARQHNKWSYMLGVSATAA